MLYPSELQPLVTRLLHFCDHARLDKSAFLRPALARDDASTVIAIVILAFALADVAREVFGYGIGFLVAGSKNGSIQEEPVDAGEFESEGSRADRPILDRP